MYLRGTVISVSFPAIDVSSVEAFVFALGAIAVFTIPVLVNVYKTAHDALTQVREVRPQVRDNTKRINEHARALDGGLDDRISAKVQELIDADGIGAGNDATAGAMPTVGEVVSTSSDSG